MKSYSTSDAHNQPLDIKLNDIFKNKTNGFFIELGANDGITYSNTAMFELEKDWTGLLIEPSVNAYTKCKANRPKSIVVNYACVSNTFKDTHVYGDFNGEMMSSVNGERTRSTALTRVSTKTLESLLDEHAPNTPIDFLSLDTEGYELNILHGLNLYKYRPVYMLIEVYTIDFDEICLFLTSKDYTLHSNFSEYSLTTNPGWDGTHNDYLFVDKRAKV